MAAPRRAIELSIQISADTWEDVRRRLFDYECYLRETGEIPAGCMGAPGCGDVRRVELDPEMTHEHYFQLLGEHIEAQHKEECGEPGADRP